MQFTEVINQKIKEMIHIQNAIFATAEEMYQNGYAIQNNDDTWMMWIKWNWFPNKEYGETYAPIVDCFTKRQEDSTHKIVGEEIYFKLNEFESGFDFENFIKNNVEIERL